MGIEVFTTLLIFTDVLMNPYATDLQTSPTFKPTGDPWSYEDNPFSSFVKADKVDLR